ncbi:Thioredoxin [Rosistilla carotiformis]|uniref:Thioredoxin n=1 Tax=Rosistilla carotiformis TaxID=2528017 RepID=A0A518JWZ0_9BACT|nr:redoxin domain-containing protein [Rosistilla carotiformis]QDV70077.1 Thioredoxin [Rosistilla carotiformis]
MLTLRPRRFWLLLVAPILVVGCGGPSQTTLDKASSETEGLASSRKLAEIDVPESVGVETAAGAVDSYDVQLGPKPSLRPVSQAKTEAMPQAAASVPAAEVTLKPATVKTPPAPLAPPTALKPPAAVKPAAIQPSAARPPAIDALADNGSLTIGDRAPQLEIVSWLKGTEVDGFDDSKVYVVEFWATWCGPCKMNMPHLSQLQQELGDQVQFIGISDEPAEKISDFFATDAAPGKTWDDVLQYTIAADRNKSTKLRYMQAAGERGIPCAFIVGRDGIVQWIGHPAQIDRPLAAILEGDWDIAAARTTRDKAKRYEMAFNALRARMGGWIKSKDFAAAIGALDAMAVEFPERNEPLMIKLEVLREAGQFAETYPVIDTLVERQWDDPNMLSQFAWLIAAETKGEDRDLDLALKAALRSVELTNEKAPIALDTAARVYFEKGNVEEAIQWQTKATALPGKFQEEMLKTLEIYQQSGK